jgi:hypothetical protein
MSATLQATALPGDANLPASLVHKRAVEQVFLTDWMEGPGDDICTIRAELPLAHARFSAGAAPYHDVVLIAEVVRQAGLVIAAKILDVPADRQFLLRELRVALDPLECNRRGPGSQAMTVVQDPSSTIKTRPSGRLTGGLMRARLYVAGERSGTAEVVGLWVPAEMYDGFRADATAAHPAPPPADAREELTGKGAAASVIAPVRAGGEPGAYTTTAIVDLDDPTFFDHPLDHAPGLLLLEAMQQLCVAAACRTVGVGPEHVVVASMDVKFERIAEFSASIDCSVALDPDGRLARVDCSQGGKVCCGGTMRIEVVG